MIQSSGKTIAIQMTDGSADPQTLTEHPRSSGAICGAIVNSPSDVDLASSAAMSLPYSLAKQPGCVENQLYLLWFLLIKVVIFNFQVKDCQRVTDLMQ